MTTKDLNITNEKDRLLLPDVSMIHHEWPDLTYRIIQSHSDYLWEHKVNKLFWRGATTGGGRSAYKISNMSNLPRLKLVILSALYPDLIDAVFTRYPSFYFEKNSQLKVILEILSKNKNQRVTQEEHQKYKYLISIDGNSSAWQRLPWIMLSNSVLVKQETSEVQWFYSALKQYYNYVPVDEELINIFTQLEWMKQHDLEVQQISQNAQNFIRNNLMPEHIYPINLKNPFFGCEI